MIFFDFLLTQNNFRTDFVITASLDGHVKFWKKQEELIEFVKHIRAHNNKAIQALAASFNGLYCCTVSLDQCMKVFDVVNFGK